MTIDKAILAEDMPIYGWTRVQTTSKFQGQAFARQINALKSMSKHYPGRAGYVFYKGKKFYNEAYRAMYPKRVQNFETHCFAGC